MAGAPGPRQLLLSLAVSCPSRLINRTPIEFGSVWSICPPPLLQAAPRHWKPSPDPQVPVLLMPSLGRHGNRVSLLRPARACVTVGPRGRAGLQPASPLVGAEAGSCWLLLPCMLFTHLQGALLTPRVDGGPGCPCGSWVSSWQAKTQHPRLSFMAPLPLHSQKAGQSYTGLYFQPGVLNYARASTHHLPKAESSYCLSCSLSFIYFWLY